MQKIKHINPGDPGIINIAKKFNKETNGKSLLKVLKLVRKDDEVAQQFLDKQLTLFNGAKQLPEASHEFALPHYLHSVALAQRRLKWEGNELLQIKRLIQKNYLRERRINALNVFLDIGDAIGEKSTEEEKNFLNYVVDKLISIYNEKKEVFKRNLEFNEDEMIDTGEVEFEVTSGENGFVLDTESPDKIIELFYEAATTPFDLQKNI